MNGFLKNYFKEKPIKSEQDSAIKRDVYALSITYIETEEMSRISVSRVVGLKIFVGV